MLYLNCFYELSGDRPTGFGEGPIPWTAIDQWARRHDIWHDDFDRLVFMVTEIDAAYLIHKEKENKKNKGK